MLFSLTRLNDCYELDTNINMVKKVCTRFWYSLFKYKVDGSDKKGCVVGGGLRCRVGDQWRVWVAAESAAEAAYRSLSSCQAVAPHHHYHTTPLSPQQQQPSSNWQTEHSLRSPEYSVVYALTCWSPLFSSLIVAPAVTRRHSTSLDKSRTPCFPYYSRRSTAVTICNSSTTKIVHVHPPVD